MRWPDFSSPYFLAGDIFWSKILKVSASSLSWWWFQVSLFSIFIALWGDYTLGSTNIHLAGTWGPLNESIVFPIEHGHIPAIAIVRNYQRVMKFDFFCIFPTGSSPVARLRSFNHLGGCSKKDPRNWIFICSVLKIWGTEMLFPPKKTSVT